MSISVLLCQQQKAPPSIWKISLESLLENWDNKLLNLMFENDKELLRIFQLQFWTNFYGVVLQDFHAGVPQDFGQAEADIITRLRPKLLAKIFIVINS